MKIARTVAIAAIAAMALTVSLGAGSALAANTTICKSGTHSPYCQAEARYPEGTSLQASSSNVTIETPIGNVACKESALEAKTGSEANPMNITLSAWTLGGCKLGGASCTAESKGSLSSTLTWTTGQEGTFSAAGYIWKLKCGVVVNCEYATPPVTVQGGAPAAIAASKVNLTKIEGGICPKSASFSATYAVSSPSKAYVAKAEPPATQLTALCSVAEFYCQSANLYPSGTVLEGASSSVVFDNPSNYGVGDFTCDEASIAAKTNAAYGAPLSVSNTSFFLGKCHWGTGGSGSCEISLLHLYNGSVSANAGGVWIGDGLWNGGEMSWRIRCGVYIDCTVTAPNGSTITIEHGEPGSIKIKNMALTVSGNGACPPSTSMSGTFPLSAPGPLVFTEVF